MDLEAVGKMAELQDDLTPLQIGTTGKYKGKAFEIIGRMKVSYDDGFWNEWYLYFPEGKHREGWLAEAQGFYAVCFDVDERVAPPRNEASSLKPGRCIEFQDRGLFEIEDIHEVKCLVSEGELPVNAMKGRESLSVDLTGPDVQMATIEYAKDEIRVFAGGYQDFDEFKFHNLREIEGW
ncbi:MAG: DUF4178 domain-containing protein [Candidatus Melainabacteria bacterium]|nr:DUF4178 domain-containing protein [Candidatus Melainabacteria bacterium]